MPLIVITGGPGAGKTTLVQALQAQGHTTVGDTARSIIQERRRRGLAARPAEPEFVREMMRIDTHNHARHAVSSGWVFFDKGVLDTLGWLDSLTPLSEAELDVWLSRYRFHPTIFILPPWPEIYTTDAERDHSFEHAQAVHRDTQAWYRRCGYELIEVPKATVDERCCFVQQKLVGSDPRRPN